MNKKLIIIAALLYIFILPSNSANAGLLDWTKSDNEQAHPFVNDSSDWSLGKLAKFDLVQKDNPPEAAPEPAPVQKPRVVKMVAKTAPTASYIVLATAYSSTPDQTDSTPFITASGTNVRDGVIAANFLPMGTQIKIPDLYGDKVFTVEDRMNRRYTYRVDIWFPERDLAKIFGVKKIKIEIINES